MAASKHTHARAQCSHASVGLAQARPNYCSVLCNEHVCAPSYRITKSFQGRKLSQIREKYDFRGDFRGLLPFATPTDAMPPNFTEKTFANSHKTAKFAKVFSLESFPLYGISLLLHVYYCCVLCSQHVCW